MFTGLVTHQARVREISSKEKALSIVLDKPKDWNDLSRGESIAVNGICLSLVNFDRDTLEFVMGFETLKILGMNESFAGGLDQWVRRGVHLERSLRLGDRLGGHWVSGHIDGVTQLLEMKKEGISLVQRWARRPEMKGLVWQKGSMVLDGVSLTINQVSGEDFEVCLIPETLQRTHLGNFTPGEWCTFECDYLAKAVKALYLDQVVHHLKEGL